ncbi:MAG TPA: hypothetical protein VNE39_11635 [Planctomycetota bacterium]|nr:hypothetical protein [Planctomycetota bacterium]
MAIGAVDKATSACYDPWREQQTATAPEEGAMLTTVRGWVRRDGHLDLEEGRVPDHDTPVLVTFLEDEVQRESAELSGLGDYADTLADYEERLARGEIQWK